jgi:hypothetical protein
LGALAQCLRALNITDLAHKEQEYKLQARKA